MATKKSRPAARKASKKRTSRVRARQRRRILPLITRITTRTRKATVPVEPPKQQATPRYSREGVLLNPDQCQVSSDGVVKGRGFRKAA